MFKVRDAFLKDETRETNTRNERRLCAIYTNHSSELEVILSLLNYIMLKLKVFLIALTLLKLKEDTDSFPQMVITIKIY